MGGLGIERRLITEEYDPLESLSDSSGHGEGSLFTTTGEISSLHSVGSFILDFYSRDRDGDGGRSTSKEITGSMSS